MPLHFVKGREFTNLMPIVFYSKMSEWTYPLWGRPRRFARKLLSLIGRALSYGAAWIAGTWMRLSCSIRWNEKLELKVLTQQIPLFKFRWVSRESLDRWWSRWCMLACVGVCVGCWNWRELVRVGAGNAVYSSELWLEGVVSYVVSCCSVVVCPCLVFNLGTERWDSGATEESECDSPPSRAEVWSRYDLCGGCARFIVGRISCSRLKPPLLSSCQSSWLLNGDVLCFLWGTNWIYICYVEESRPPGLDSTGLTE
jgi:hypothetical protein